MREARTIYRPPPRPHDIKKNEAQAPQYAHISEYMNQKFYYQTFELSIRLLPSRLFGPVRQDRFVDSAYESE